MTPTLRLFAALSLAALASPVARAADGKKCTIATKPETAVGKACQEGGVAKAKKAMKLMVKQAKDAGMKTECDACHKNDTTYELTKDGRAQFDKMSKAIAGR